MGRATCALEGATRSTKRSHLSPVIALALALEITSGTFWEEVKGATARATADDTTPTSTSTRSDATSLRALLRPTSGLASVSSTISLIWRPATSPPASSTASCMPLSCSAPMGANTPVIGSKTPTLRGSAACALCACNRRTAAKAFSETCMTFLPNPAALCAGLAIYAPTIAKRMGCCNLAPCTRPPPR